MGYTPSYDDLPASTQPVGSAAQPTNFVPSYDDIPQQTNSVSQNLINQVNTAQANQDWYKTIPKVNTFLGQLPANMNDPRVQQYIRDTAWQTAIGSLGGGLGAEINAPTAYTLMSPQNYDAAVQAAKPAQQQVNEFMGELSGNYDKDGNIISDPKTAQDNISDLSRRVFFARNSAANEALKHKNIVMQGNGILPGLADSNISAPINFNGQMLSTDQLGQIQAQLKQRASTIQNNILMAKQNSNPFNAQAVDISIQPLQDSLAQHQETIDQIDTLKNQGLKYLSSDMSGINFGSGPGSIREANQNFTMNPTLSNSDTLYKRLGSRWGDLNETPRGERLDPQIIEMNNIRQAQANLRADQTGYMNQQNPLFQQEWNNYSNKWANNVGIYDDTPVIRTMARGQYDKSQGTNIPITSGFKPSEIKSAFSFEPQSATKIAQDLGPAGKGNILYNELQSVGEMPPGDLGSSILAARQTGGYQNIVTPEMRAFADRMQAMSDQLNQPSRLAKTAKFLKEEGTAYGVGSVVGHPWLALALKHLAKKAK